MTKPQLYSYTAHSYRFASIFCFFLCFSFYPKYIYSNNLNKLIEQLTEHQKTPSLVRLDYHEKKYQRDKKSSKKVTAYRQKIGGFQHAMWMLFQKIYSKEIKKERIELGKNNFITIEETINSLSNLQKKGIDIQTGDIIFTLPHQSSSYQIAKYAKSKYSHGGLIWIEEDKMSAIEVHSKADLVKIPLADYLYPKRPHLHQISILRFLEKYDVDEFEYFFNISFRHKENILFDPLFTTNPLIKDPEFYFQKNQFLYCTEYIYLAYNFILNREDILAEFKVDFQELFRNITKNNKKVMSYLPDLKTQSNMISFNNFTKSPHFKIILDLKASN